jgi:predicted PurR-regulated permease PerM
MNGLIIFLGIIFILFLGRAIFVPLLVAAFLWYLINSIAAYYRKVLPCRILPYTKSKAGAKCSLAAGRAFDWAAMILSLATIGGLAYAFVTRIRPMAAKLLASLPDIQIKLRLLLDYVSSAFGISADASKLPDLAGLAANAGAGAAGATMALGLVLIYILFMFIEQSTFKKKLAAMFPEKRQLKKMRFILTSIDENMKKYMFMKTLISAATAACSYLWMHCLGLEFAGVWAFIIFILNYIPTFGSIIACALPILYSIVTAQALDAPILVAGGLIVLQIVFANLLEPKLTGETLNLSTLAILVNLMFWGILWGAAGAFFSVPLLVATFVITAQFDRTRWIAILLSANGNIPDKEED